MGLCHTRRMTWLGALGVAHREACAAAVCQVRGELPEVGWGWGTPLPHAADPPGCGAPAYSANTSSPELICPGRQPRNLGPQAPPVGSPSQAAPLPGCSPVHPHLEQRAVPSLMPLESLSTLGSPGTQYIKAPNSQALSKKHTPAFWVIDSSGNHFLLSRGALSFGQGLSTHDDQSIQK